MVGCGLHGIEQAGLAELDALALQRLGALVRGSVVAVAHRRGHPRADALAERRETLGKRGEVLVEQLRVEVLERVARAAPQQQPLCPPVNGVRRRHSERRAGALETVEQRLEPAQREIVDEVQRAFDLLARRDRRAGPR